MKTLGGLGSVAVELNIENDIVDNDPVQKGEPITRKEIDYLVREVRDVKIRVSDIENSKPIDLVPVGLLDLKEDLAETQTKLNNLIISFNKALNLKSV